MADDWDESGARTHTDVDPQALRRARALLQRATVPGFRLVAETPSDASWTSSEGQDRCTIGSHPSNPLVLDHGTVSRFHCEVRVGPGGATVTDLESRNGTFLDGVRVGHAWLAEGSVLELGRARVRFELAGGEHALRLASTARLGALVGESVAMRTVFDRIGRLAALDGTVLIHGETGTGKDGAAHALHELGPRRTGPFVVVDCGAISPSLLESELFGHEKGAFTGATESRKGAFEEADGGTVFLDEVGELPLALQPKLLRVLESRTIRRVGASRHAPVDLRVVAATNRPLRAEVNHGRFRADLYYRLAVLELEMPPLRARPEDIRCLVEHFLERLGAGPRSASLLESDWMEQATHAAWPGNVRQLRNHVEQWVLFEQPPPVPAPTEETLLPYEQAKALATREFERRYVADLLRRHAGNVAAAAEAAGMNRSYLYRLIRRHED